MINEDVIEEISSVIDEYNKAKRKLKEDLMCKVARLIPYKELVPMYPMHEVGEVHMDYDMQGYIDDCKKTYLTIEDNEDGN